MEFHEFMKRAVMLLGVEDSVSAQVEAWRFSGDRKDGPRFSLEWGAYSAGRGQSWKGGSPEEVLAQIERHLGRPCDAVESVKGVKLPEV